MSKMSRATLAGETDIAIGEVCRALRIDLWRFVQSWDCYKAGETEHVLALLDSRDRDNLLREFGRYLLERRPEFASND